MKRSVFNVRLNHAEPLSKEKIDEIVKFSIDKDPSFPFEGFMNMIIAQEELNELDREVSKYLRNKGSRIDLLQEMADVQLAIYYIQEVFHISDDELDRAISVKALNTEDVVKAEGRYQ